MIKRAKKLKIDDDVTAKNVEELLNEISSKVPTEDDYRVNIIERKTITNKVPKGMRVGEIRIDSSQLTKKLIVCIEDNGVKKTFGIELSAVGETGDIDGGGA